MVFFLALEKDLGYGDNMDMIQSLFISKSTFLKEQNTLYIIEVKKFIVWKSSEV